MNIEFDSNLGETEEAEIVEHAGGTKQHESSYSDSSFAIFRSEDYERLYQMFLLEEKTRHSFCLCNIH